MEQLGSPLGGQNSHLWGGWGVPPSALHPRSQGEVGAPDRSFAAVLGFVCYHGEQPWPEGGTGLETPQGAVRLDERLLGRILGLRGIARGSRTQS